MPRPHQDAEGLVDRVLVGKVGTHILTGDEKNDEQKQSKDQM